MNEEDILKNETLEKLLSPHPLSFMRYQSLSIFLIIWGVISAWILNIFRQPEVLIDNFWGSIFIWGIPLLIVGIIASLITIRWSVFGLFLLVFISGVGIIFWLNLQENVNIFTPSYTISISIIGFLIVECYRRSHKYIISNLRITFKGGIFTKEERTLRYDKISDINSKQGILGQIFGFGTIIPISQSGFGLGSDKSLAAGGVSLGGKKARLFGIFGGGKEVQTPRARSYYELHGVYPYKEIKKLIEEKVQGSVITQYQQEQVAFQKEQVDIQKQMRDLLKIQSENKVEEDTQEEDY
jgi:hypothetical protein